MSDSNAANTPTQSRRDRRIPWWAKAIALIALLNLLMGLFNLSYVPLRDAYLRYVPTVVSLYDPIKGIDPHPQTQRYLRMAQTVQTTIARSGLRSPESKALLEKLRRQSNALIEEDPFMAQKLAMFAKVKRRMRQHVGTETAKEAFQKFWTVEYLSSQGWTRELSFFDTQIRAPLRTNYFRETDENGQFIDRFWLVDTVFIVFFGIDFLVRTLVISRQMPGINWFDGMLRRWYDIFLLLPVWRWLRIIPVTIRLHKAKIIDLERILSQVTYEPAAYLSDRVSEFVTIRTIDQWQDSIRQGEAARAFLEPKEYVRVGDIDEVEAIADRLLELTIYKVVPKVQPNIEELLHYSLTSSLQQSAFYETLRNVPAIQDLPDDAMRQVSTYLARATTDVLASSYSDEQGRKVFDRLTEQFNTALREELKDEETMRELETMLTNLLEEWKLNYVQKSAQRDPEETLEEVEKIYRQTIEEAEEGNR
jgi:translation initiation factor 2B subunit (eIF-2B alpha/beta/delta family)